MNVKKQWMWIAASLLLPLFAGCLQGGVVDEELTVLAGEDTSENGLQSNHGGEVGMDVDVWPLDGIVSLSASASVSASCIHEGEGVYKTSASAVGQATGSSLDAGASYYAEAHADAGSAQSGATESGSGPSSKDFVHAATDEVTGYAFEGFVVTARAFAEGSSPVLGTVSTEKIASATCGGGVDDACDAVAEPEIPETSETDTSASCTASIQAVPLGDQSGL